MKVDVTFVKCPASDEIRALISEKIESRVGKFAQRISATRAVFSTDGFRHHVRLTIVGDMKMTVTSSANDIGRSLELAIDKLSTAIRKSASRRKLRNLADHPWRVDSGTELEKHPRQPLNCPLNVFDRYEAEFTADFEEAFDHAV